MSAAQKIPEAVREQIVDASIGIEVRAWDHDEGTTAPELSLRSGLALAGSALAYFSTVGFMNAYGVFQQYYTAHYLPTYSNFQISWVGSFATFMLFTAALPAGFLADRYGATIPLCVGAVLQLLAVFMVSLCREYYQFFLAQGILLAIGMGFVAIPASTIVPMYFKRNRGLAQGVSIAGSSLGGVLWPLALDQLLNHDAVGFGWSMRIVGFTMIPLLAIAILCLRPPHTPTAKKEAATDPNTSGSKKSKVAHLRTRPFILLCAGLALSYFGFWEPLFYTTTYAVHIGASESLAFYLLSVLNGASLFGRILPGLVADRIGHFNILCMGVLLSALLSFVWTAATSIAGLIVWTAAYGFVSGCIMSLQLACATVLAGDDGGIGAAVGVMMASISLTGLFGTLIAGELVAAGGYVALSCFAGATLVLGGSLLVAARLSRDRSLFAKV